MTFADNYNIRSSQLSGNNIASALDALLGTFATDTFGATNTTSGSFADISGASLSITTASGEILILAARVRLSHGTAGAQSQLVFDVDGSDVGLYDFTGHANDTGGDEMGLTMFHAIAAPSVGAHTVKLQWLTGAGTLYTAGGEFFALALQNT